MGEIYHWMKYKLFKIVANLGKHARSLSVPVSMATESQHSQSRIQIRASWTIEIPRDTVKHLYSPIKVNERNGVSCDRWSNPEDLRALINISNLLGTSKKLLHYLAQKVSLREHELQSIKDSVLHNIGRLERKNVEPKSDFMLFRTYPNKRLARSRWQNSLVKA